MSNAEKLRKAIEWLGTRWILHPSNQVKRKDDIFTQTDYDAERWTALMLLWGLGQVTLTVDDAGMFVVDFEGAESADRLWKGKDPEACLRKVIESFTSEHWDFDALPAQKALDPEDTQAINDLLQRARSKTYREGPDEIYYNLPNLHEELADMVEMLDAECCVRDTQFQNMMQRQADALAALKRRIKYLEGLVEHQSLFRSDVQIANENEVMRGRIAELEQELSAANEKIATEYVRGREHEQRARATVENSHIASLNERIAALARLLRRLVAEFYYRTDAMPKDLRADIDEALKETPNGN